MTAFYDSTAVPKEVFGEGDLLNIFYETLQEEAPAAWELKEAFSSLWDPNTLSHNWVLPDNFHTKVKVMTTSKETVHFMDQPIDIFTKVNAPVESGRSLGANAVHSIDGMIVREMARRCDYNPDRNIEVLNILGNDAEFRKEPCEDDLMVATLWEHYQRSGYLSARILDHIQPSNVNLIDRNTIIDLIQSMPKQPFKVVSVHDCFRCLPQYGNALREQYNNQLMLIARSNMLSYLVSQLLNKSVTIRKRTPALYKQVIESNYALS